MALINNTMLKKLQLQEHVELVKENGLGFGKRFGDNKNGVGFKS